jgi:MFS family permease
MEVQASEASDVEASETSEDQDMLLDEDEHSINDKEFTLQHEVQELSFTSLLAITIGFGTDAYIVFLMNILLLVLTIEFDPVDPIYVELVATSVIVGIILGQIIFGKLADRYKDHYLPLLNLRFGRTRMFMITMVMIALFSILSAAAPILDNTGKGTFIWLSVMRFFLGLGRENCLKLKS